MYSYHTKIRLHQTDPAGLIFFSQQFEIIHDAYECLLASVGFGFGKLINEMDFFIPIVHAQADYKLPLSVEDTIDVQVTVDHVGSSSFTFGYQILNAQQQCVGTGKTVHVTMDKKKKKKIPIPSDLRQKIEQLFLQDHPSS